ncbi:hypothetical protein BJV78DRAFT_1355048 [Lactifluus subvellereus]|nr:hypothetical protein BJV78DRAFT_1355048 [Lactifluus subvellereus]
MRLWIETVWRKGCLMVLVALSDVGRVKKRELGSLRRGRLGSGSLKLKDKPRNRRTPRIGVTGAPSERNGLAHLGLGPCSAPCTRRRTAAWVPRRCLPAHPQDLVCENPERRNMLPEDAERGETDAALAVLRRLATAEDSDTMVVPTKKSEISSTEQGLRDTPSHTALAWELDTRCPVIRGAVH